nr:TlpA disulfide reductase family protein [Lysinibacillus timonensis]
MPKKGLTLCLLALIICAFSWTIYANLFKANEISDSDVVFGSHDLVNEEELSIEADTYSQDTNISGQDQPGDDYDEKHVGEQGQIQDEEHPSEINENGVGHVWDGGHSHVINHTEVVEVQEKAPQFITKTLDGQTVKLSDFLGKKVIINFWATWCPPCQEEIPELQKFYETSAQKHNVVLLGLNITSEDLGIDVIHDFREYYGITYPILLDETGEITESYDIITIPTTYIIDEEGKLEKQITGPLTDAMLNELLTEM